MPLLLLKYINDAIPYRMGFGYSFSTLSQGEKWRTRRKLFSAFFTPDAITAYHHLQVRYARSLAHQLLSEPNDFRDLSRR